MDPHELVLEARQLRKHYGPLVASDAIDLGLRRGEIVALVGDNGAGKSTLVRMLCGASRPDSGQIFHRGQPVTFSSPHEARERGIETVYQDLALAPNRDVAANLFLGREIIYGGVLRPLGLLNRREMVDRTNEHLRELGIQIPRVTGTVVGRLSGGQQQAIAVARAAAWASDALFMDEPTAALGVQQSKAVLTLARRVADRGVAVVLITHILPHVLEVADRVVVLRHGQKVADLPAAQVTSEQLIALIVGFEVGTGAAR